MPTAEENIQFLYLILTQGGSPTIDWDSICTALSLEKGAVTKRWSRLKQAMEKGETPTTSNYEFLWLMVKHSTRDKSYDWDAIAKACNSTKGACSKRYSRLKLAFERGDAVPSTPGKANKSATVTPKKTPLKAKVNTEDGESTATSTPKRKRTAAKKVDYAESEDDEEDQDEQPKRAKSNPRPKPRPKNGFRASDEKMPSAESQSVVKGEPNESDGDVFTDAPEQALADVDAEGEIDEVLPTSIFSEKFTHAREMADVLLNRKTGLTSEQRSEVEGMLDVFHDAA